MTRSSNIMAHHQAHDNMTLYLTEWLEARATTPGDDLLNTIVTGELVLVVKALAGLDDRVVDDPMRVDFHREKPAHATFGNGRHACPGALLALREIKVFLEEWLARIPDFAIKPGTTPEIGCGIVNGVAKLELAW